VSVIVVMLLLINFLNSPFHHGIGGVRPVAMERTLSTIDRELLTAGGALTLPCDDEGNTAP